MTTDLPPQLQPRRLTTDPYNPRTVWVIRCVIPGCRTGFYAEAATRADIDAKARAHWVNDHGGPDAA